MKVIYLFLLTVLSSLLELHAQELPSRFICWNESGKLQWCDFKGEPDTTGINYVMKAATATNILPYQERKEGLPYYKLLCVFDKERSWTKDTISSELLRHEQIHFNIAELYTRKMRKAVDSLRELKIKEVSVYHQVIKSLSDERNAYDYTFDKETGYSVNKAAQDEWYEKVQAELAALAEYSLDSLEYKCVTWSEEEEEEE